MRSGDSSARRKAIKTPEESADDTIGDAWACVALERASKLVLAFTVGKRTLENAMSLMRKVRRATSPDSPFQLTTDGLKLYIPAVDAMLLDGCDLRAVDQSLRCSDRRR